jgi:hypothetical protein
MPRPPILMVRPAPAASSLSMRPVKYSTQSPELGASAHRHDRDFDFHLAVEVEQLGEAAGGVEALVDRRALDVGRQIEGVELSEQLAVEGGLRACRLAPTS